MRPDHSWKWHQQTLVNSVPWAAFTERTQSGPLEGNCRVKQWEGNGFVAGKQTFKQRIKKKEKKKGVAQRLTDDTKGLPGKAQPTLPSSVATAASRWPDTDDEFQPEHHNHHKLLLEA